MKNQNAITALSQTLAEEYLLMLKTQNFHWNVEGPLFYSLHKLFEEQYTFLAAQVDEVAERIRALGERAPGSYREFLKISKVEEAPADRVNAMRMIEILNDDHESIVKRLEQFRAQADEIKDNTSVSIYDGLISFHQKAAWMIRSHR
ncbi:Dps family protein [Bdellovibrio sp. HCB337]|uniref:Dps family protein n=1 Tax=Bdellovibrio sp. HCB337 TaxID=3394358 RepID=UPI0039A6268F